MLFCTRLSVILLGIKFPVTSRTYINLCSQRPCCVFGLQKPEGSLQFILDHGKSDLVNIIKNTYPLYLNFSCCINFPLFWWWMVDTWRNYLFKKKKKALKWHKCDLKREMDFICFTREGEIGLEIHCREMSELFCWLSVVGNNVIQ